MSNPRAKRSGEPARQVLLVGFTRLRRSFSRAVRLVAVPNAVTGVFFLDTRCIPRAQFNRHAKARRIRAYRPEDQVDDFELRWSHSSGRLHPNHFSESRTLRFCRISIGEAREMEFESGR